jgi:hypothetical protein
MSGQAVPRILFILVPHAGQMPLAIAPAARLGELAAATISLKDLEAARNRRRRELRTELTSRRNLVDALRHPHREPVPPEAVTTLEEPPAAAPSTPKRTTKLKLYRED